MTQFTWDKSEIYIERKGREEEGREERQLISIESALIIIFKIQSSLANSHDFTLRELILYFTLLINSLYLMDRLLFW